jgi:hypothetical protein
MNQIEFLQITTPFKDKVFRLANDCSSVKEAGGCYSRGFE